MPCGDYLIGRDNVRVGVRWVAIVYAFARLTVPMVFAILGWIYVWQPVYLFSNAPVEFNPSVHRGLDWQNYTYLYDPGCTMGTNETVLQYLQSVLQPNYITTCGCDTQMDYPAPQLMSGWTAFPIILGLLGPLALVVAALISYLNTADNGNVKTAERCYAIGGSPLGVTLLALFIASIWTIFANVYFSWSAMTICFPNSCDRNGFGDAVNVSMDNGWIPNVDYATASISTPEVLSYIQTQIIPSCSNVELDIDPPSYTIRVPMLPHPLLAESLLQAKNSALAFAVWMLKLCWIPLLIISPATFSTCPNACRAYWDNVCTSLKTCMCACCCNIPLAQQAPAIMQISPAPASANELAPPPYNPAITVHV